MSEKKFALQTVGDTVVRNNQTNEIYWNHNLVHLINSLSKENEQLKFENETLKSNYQREIQSSIDFCNAYSKTNGELLEEIEKLEKENEQLRKYNELLIKQKEESIDRCQEIYRIVSPFRRE